MSMWREETPLEEYKVNGATVYVKREDLYGIPPAPPLAKLRGARIYIERLKRSGLRKVGVFDTRISKAGQGVACICKELGLECIAGFPQLKSETELSQTHKIAEEQGAKLVPLRAGRTAVCYAQFSYYVRETDGFMLPLGLVCRDTVTQTARVAEKALRMAEKEGVRFRSIVLSTGTGTIATGVHLGTKSANVRIYGVSCGMSVAEQYTRMKAIALPEVLDHNLLTLVWPEYDYYDALDTSACPFPTSPYYDMKAWTWLTRNLDKLEQPICFWNIGS